MRLWRHMSEQVSYARIQDSQKKFLEASLKYYQLSQTQDDVRLRG